MFWDVVDELDQNCWVLEPEHPTKADVARRIAVGKNMAACTPFRISGKTEDTVSRVLKH